MSREDLNITSSLEGLQTDEQRQVLDTVAQIRKCGLESILSLPQLVVCGDQSAGKSSVLEALTEIPFPRKDNLCTRFATEIILRRAESDCLAIKVIPDAERSSKEQESIKGFNESITDFNELPGLIDKAMVVMGIDEDPDPITISRAFARDVLSIVIEGPSRPQLTLVDLPGLIQTETRGVTMVDVKLVAEITDHYISQPRTICLAVVSALNDVANQGILTRVRAVDPEGERTLGIITKPDRLEPGSGMETGFVNLARNENVFFKLGWHVLRNRSFNETADSFTERNIAETSYFRTSNFKVLPKDCVGIDTLRTRLSRLLFDHVKRELPKLRRDLDKALADAKNQLGVLGNQRATTGECRSFLAQLSLGYYDVCKEAVNGHYEGGYFVHNTDWEFSLCSPISMRRLRALVQYMNIGFAKTLRTNGYKYHINKTDTDANSGEPAKVTAALEANKLPTNSIPGTPAKMSKAQALEWVNQVLLRTRGRELPGNFNPLVVGELFWEQSSNWCQLAVDHMERVALVCSEFLRVLLADKCPEDIHARLWSFQIQDTLNSRCEAAKRELEMLIEDIRNYPINYNHYYTDTIRKQRQERESKALAKCVKDSTKTENIYNNDDEHYETTTTVDVEQVIKQYRQHIEPDMDKYSSEEALDCMMAIFKVINVPKMRL